MLFQLVFQFLYYFQIDVDPNIEGDVTVERIQNEDLDEPDSISLGKEYIIYYRYLNSGKLTIHQNSNKWKDVNGQDHNPHACLSKGI